MHASARIAYRDSDNIELGVLGGHLVRINDNFYMCLGKRGVFGSELYGVTPISWDSTSQVVSSPQKWSAAKPNSFSCLSIDDEDSGSDSEDHSNKELTSDRDKERIIVVEEMDLQNLTVYEATCQIRDVMERFETDERPAAVVNCTHKNHALFTLGESKTARDGKAPLKTAVQRWLKRLGVKYGTQRDNKARVWVDLDTAPESRFVKRKEATLFDFGYVGDILHLLSALHRQLRYGAPRIMGAIAAPQRRTELPMTFFKGRCTLKDVEVPDDVCDEHQLEALRSIRHNVTAIQGPPGTGKTTIIANILAYGIPQLTTLVTCVQNKAIDPIAHKLAKSGVPFLVVAREECAGCLSTTSKLCPFSRRHTVWAYASRDPQIISLSGMHAVAILEHLLAQERLEYIQRRAIAAIHFDAIEETCEGGGGWDMSQWVQLQKRYCLHVSEQHRLVTHDNYHVALAKTVRDITTRTSVFLSTVDCAHTVPFYLLQQSGRKLDAMIVDEAGAVPEWCVCACGCGRVGVGVSFNYSYT